MTDAREQHLCEEKPYNIRIRYVKSCWTLYDVNNSAPHLVEFHFCPYCGEKLTKGDAE